MGSFKLGSELIQIFDVNPVPVRSWFTLDSQLCIKFRDPKLLRGPNEDLKSNLIKALMQQWW